MSARATISAREWNAWIAAIQRNQLVQVLGAEPGGWQHPWFTTVQWSGLNQRFEASVKPGFVNGEDVTASVENDKREIVDVALTDAPSIPLTLFRRIGSDADPVSSVVSEGGDVVLSFEPVPDFFLARGVRSARKIEGNTDLGLLQQLTGAEATADLPQRRLRACDLVLYHDRPGLATATLDATTLTVGVKSPTGAHENAYIRTTRRYEGDAPPDPIQQLLGNWTDTTRDSLPVATVYLLSPEDTAEDETPDQTWTPFVQHALFWNLLYRHNNMGVQPNANPFTLVTGLAGGVADPFIAARLAEINDATRQALDFLANQRIEGRFWSI